VLSFQGEGAAPTVAASGRQAATRQPAPPPPQYAAPAPQYAAPAPPKKGGNPLLIGCLVLVVLCILVLIGGFIFDYLNLYCVSPFNILFGLITTCG
jgi:hypothetical protein